MTVRVNEVEIADHDIGLEMQYHPAADPEQAKSMACRALIVRHLLLEDAKSLNLCTDYAGLSVEDEEALVDQVIEQRVSVPEASHENCLRYYQNNIDKFHDQHSGQALDFELVVDKIQKYLHMRSLHTGIAHYLRSLVDHARIEGHQLT